MGQPWPQFPSDVQGGDDATFSPQKGQNSLLASQRGTQRARRIETDEAGNVYVDVAAGSVTIVPSATGVNLFATSNVIASGTETILLSYTTTFPFHISQIIGWGNVDAEFLIKVNGVTVGGGFSSPSNRTLNVEYSVAPIPTLVGDMVTVTVRQDSGSVRRLRVNLLGE